MCVVWRSGSSLKLSALCSVWNPGTVCGTPAQCMERRHNVWNPSTVCDSGTVCGTPVKCVGPQHRVWNSGKVCGTSVQCVALRRARGGPCEVTAPWINHVLPVHWSNFNADILNNSCLIKSMFFDYMYEYCLTVYLCQSSSCFIVPSVAIFNSGSLDIFWFKIPESNGWYNRLPFIIPNEFVWVVFAID